MHRIDTEGHAAGMWQEGDPQIGQQGTIMGAAWLNDVQENLVKVILDAGIALVKGNSGQLKAAIQAMINSSAVSWAAPIATAKAEAIASANATTTAAVAAAKAEAIASANATMTAAVAAAKAEAIAATRLRVGTVVMMDGPFDPTGGYVELDTNYLRASYPDLVAYYQSQGRLIAGTTGAHFRTPDYQGLFARAASTDATVDPDGPRGPGDIQQDAFEAHGHGAGQGQSASGNPSYTPGGYSSGDDYTTSVVGYAQTQASGGDETRPKNVAFTWAIKT